MQCYSLDHLSDHTLIRDLAVLVARDRETTAELLAHIAEVDARKLYLPAAYPSMYAYCMGELHLCEQAALKRILAARTARRFPAVFEALADGRLHLSAVVLLAPHLREDTAEELLAAATHKSKAEIEQLLAERFPRPDVLTWVQAAPPPSLTRPPEQQAPSGDDQLSPGIVSTPLAPAHVGERPPVTPLAAQAFAVQFTMSQAAHEKLRYAQELLGHQIPSGDIAAVFERALDALIPQLEKRKFAATTRPRPGHRHSTAGQRHVPAHVKRAVWQRDGGQCTFVSDTGCRCPARTLLEFDHVDPVARGGEASVGGIRLRCRAHNQYTAECTFGTEFMRHKRLAAAEARAAAKGGAAAARAQTAAEQGAAADQALERTQERASEQAQERDVVPWLRQLGYSASEAHRAAAFCEDLPNASLEERVRVALSCFRLKGTRVARA